MSVRRPAVPLIRQSEAAECGLAALAMVAAFHGHHCPLPELRARCGWSARGTDLRQLLTAAGTLGLSARAVRLEPEQLNQLACPAILHWQMDHFVVLERVDGDTLHLVDPARGRQRMRTSEADRALTGVAVELRPAADFRERKAVPPPGLRALVGPTPGLRAAFASILTLTLALYGLVLLGPLFLQTALDHSQWTGDVSAVWPLAAVFLLAALLQVGLTWLRNQRVARLSARLGIRWHLRVFAHLLRLPASWFERRQLGEVMSRMGAVDDIRRVLSGSFVEALLDGALAIGILAVMACYSMGLAGLAVVAVLAYGWFRRLAFGALQEAQAAQLAASARQHSHVFESIRGIQALRVAGAEHARHADWHHLLAETTHCDLQLVRIDNRYGSAGAVVFAVERIAAVCLGVTLLLGQQLSLGMLVAFLAYKEQFSARAAGLIDRVLQLRMLRVHLSRLADVMHCPVENHFAATHGLTPVRAEIEFRDLGYRYGSDAPWILRHCDAHIREGEVVAIIGVSGAGKSTLARLLLGLLPAAEGSVRVDGQPLAQIDGPAYRRFAAAVLQDDHIFGGTLADNISLFDADVTPEAIAAAAQRAGIHADILAWPMGYRTRVGEHGAALSGGQRQRVLLARALYRQPRLLILDEASSLLDPACERAVNAAIRALPLTRIVIAHRSQTIAMADRILQLEQGRLRELPRAQWLDSLADVGHGGARGPPASAIARSA